jgi:hypothetical protein
MRGSLIKKMKEENQGDPEIAVLESSNFRVMDNAQI